MTEQDALLQAIIANPADDQLRLVYCDWLEENAGQGVPCSACGGSGWEGPPLADVPPVRERVGRGGRIERYVELQPPRIGPPPKCPACEGTGRVADTFAERAELCRVQMELAKPGSAMSPETKALKARERELLDAHWRAWAPWATSCANLPYGGGPPPPWPVPTGFVVRVVVHFRRGFVAEVEGPLATLRGNLPRLAAREPIELARPSDKSPRRVISGYEWCCEAEPRWGGVGDWVMGPAEHSLPYTVWVQPGLSFDSLGRPFKETVVWRTEDQAYEALTVVLLNEARREGVRR